MTSTTAIRQGRYAWFAVPLTIAAVLAAIPWTLGGPGFVVFGACAVGWTVVLSLFAAHRLTAKGEPRTGRSLLAGATIALLSHFGMALPFVTSLEGWLGFSILSVLFYGWVTVPLGVLASWLAVRRRAKRSRSAVGTAIGAP